MRTFLASVVIILIFGMNAGDCARILSIFPKPSISHQLVYREFTLALNERGHDLVVVTPTPINDPTLKNYKEIDISILNNMVSPINFYDTRRSMGWSPLIRKILINDILPQTEAIFENLEFQKIYSRQSNETFDLLIVELPTHQAFYALAARFHVPLIGLLSLGLIDDSYFAVGDLVLSSHPSNWAVGNQTGFHLPFWKRLTNYVVVWYNVYFFKSVFIPKNQEIAQKYLGNEIPYIGDIEKYISLIFVNQQAALSYARPNVPMVIPFGGFHLSREDQPMPKDLKEFLDGATEGFVYMSLGSSVRSTMLPASVRDDIIDVFSKLPQRIVWKFEDDTLPGKPDNVYISKWLPQRSVLAHPNIKVFVYQGGLQSTEEAIEHAVPLVGMPVICDQDTTVGKMVSLGVARGLEIIDLNKTEFNEAVRDVISNKGYKEKMLELRTLVNDRPYDLLDNAVWWTEFVIRHRGASHLRCSIADDPWYRRFDMDIIAFLSIAAFTLVVLFLIISHKIITWTFRSFVSSRSATKRKRS